MGFRLVFFGRREDILFLHLFIFCGSLVINIMEFHLRTTDGELF